MMKLWNMFNGYKTNIGAGCMIAGIFITEVVIGIWQVDAAWIPKLASTFNWIGAAVSATGLGHKGIKQLSQ